MVDLFKKIVFKLYVIGLMCFTVWYGFFMFPLIFGFEGKEEARASLEAMRGGDTEEEQMYTRLLTEQTKKKTTDLGYKKIQQPYIDGRFHHIGFNIQKDEFSTCVRCHGNVPHDESKEIRSFLNMHTFYLACETCHSQPAKGDKQWKFSWYDKTTGQKVSNPQALLDIEKSYTSDDEKWQYPIFGNYGAKITPTMTKNNEQRLLHGKKEMDFVVRYLNDQKNLESAQKSQMKKVIHRKVSKQPVECKTCHKRGKTKYIPFETLGYPPMRIDELTDLAVVGMIQKYKKFYLPNFLNPGGVNK
ncbi:MAG: hypothetical protein OEY52_00645 [Gammaproteobacteria bacterium]|nr:hypothetical protein [Gammaproteobacteria bacterium]